MVKLLVAHGANRQLRNKVNVTEVMRLCVNGLVYCMVTNILIVAITMTVCHALCASHLGEYWANTGRILQLIPQSYRVTAAQHRNTHSDVTRDVCIMEMHVTVFSYDVADGRFSRYTLSYGSPVGARDQS